MRFRLNLLFYPLLGLAACQPELNPGPRVDFVASSRFTTGARRLTTPGDTVATRIYGQAQGKDSPLTRLQIIAEYKPVPEGIIYPQTGYDEGDEPSFKLLYLDTLLPAATEQFAFQSVQPSRTTGGQEVWTYEFRDSEDRTGSRSLKLRVGRNDSLLTYHSYTIGLQAPLTNSQVRRSFLALRSGLALPKFTVRTAPQNADAQQLIDLVYIPNAATGPGLATPSNSLAGLPATKWPAKRVTQLRSTGLNETNFGGLTTAAQLTATFESGASFTNPTYTGRVTKNQVIAFLTPEGKSGAILVQDITTTGIPTLVLQVRITK